MAEQSDPRSRPRRLPGQRQTRQRSTIYEVIRTAAGPLTVPEIHQRAQREVGGIGIATVYRTINLLQDEGLVQAVILPSGETRYELANLGHHHHFSCRSCEEVFDLPACPVEIPRNDVVEGGFVVESHELTLYGVCPACVETPAASS